MSNVSLSSSDDLLELVGELLAQESDDLQGWFDEQIERFYEATRREMSRIASTRVLTYASTVIAAGDVAAFDGAQAEWLLWVDGYAAAEIESLFLTGGVVAWLESPAGGGLSIAEALRGGPGLPDIALGAREAEIAAEMVVNLNARAIDYVQGATNRIVGAGPELWSLVQDTAIDGFRDGRSIDATAAVLEDVAGFTEVRAERIARTEVVGAYNGGELDGMLSIPVEARPVEKSWLATADARTRQTHLDANGQTVPIDGYFDVGGVPMERPLDPAAPPEEVVNCRCTTLFLFPGDVRPDGSRVE